MLAAFLKVPEIGITKEEADKLAKASANVARHYDVSATQKTLDWTNLAMAIAMVYGTRIMAINFRRKMTPSAPTNPADDNGGPILDLTKNGGMNAKGMH